MLPELKPLIQIREFDSSDYPMVSGWWKSRKGLPIPANILPKFGLIIEEDSQAVAALWTFMDNSVGVAFLEFVVTRPGRSPQETREAISHGITFIKQRLFAMGYGVLFVRAKEAIARCLESEGFMVTEPNLVGMFSTTEAE